MQKRFIYVGLIAMVVLVGGYFAYTIRHEAKQEVDGFSLDRISVSDTSHTAAVEIPVTSEELDQANAILTQSFYYVSYRFGCYAFISQDGEYVLKFPRQTRFTVHSFYEYLPNFWVFKDMRDEKIQKKQKRQDAFFKSLRCAFLEAPDETGVVFAHIKKTQNQHPLVSINDKMGTSYDIPIDKYAFFIQKKTKPVQATFRKLIQNKETEKAKERINQIFSLLTTSAEKGILDIDSEKTLEHELGFLSDRAIFVDVGALKKSTQGRITKKAFISVLKNLKPLHMWLIGQSPSLGNYFEQAKNQAIEHFGNE